MSEPLSWQIVTREADFEPDAGVLSAAVQADRLEIVQWFFLPAQMAYMRPSLAAVWPRAALVAVRTKRLEILELLLGVSTTLYASYDRQALLDALLISSESIDRDVMQILLAHGARVDTGMVQERCGLATTTQVVDTFVAEGVQIVGAAVGIHTYCSRNALPVARRLLEAGVDFGSGCELLHEAAKEANTELMQVFLCEAYVDVDGCNAAGRTALMEAVSMESNVRTTLEYAPVVAQTLLDAGADVRTTDRLGWTALHHAIYSEFIEVARLLLRHGASANAVVLDGDFMRQLIGSGNPGWTVIQKIELLEGYGADFDTPASDGVTLTQRLMESEAGRELIAAHAQYAEMSEAAEQPSRPPQTPPNKRSRLV